MMMNRNVGERAEQDCLGEEVVKVVPEADCCRDYRCLAIPGHFLVDGCRVMVC